MKSLSELANLLSKINARWNGALIFLVLVIISGSKLHAQELPYAWNNSIQPLRVISTTAVGSTAYSISDMFVDAAGNRYITGYYNGKIDFDPSSGTSSLTSTTNTRDIYIAKYDSQGNLVFAKTIGNANSSEVGNGIFSQPGTNNIIITGVFFGTMDFDPGAGTANLISNANSGDSFILLLDQSGNYVNAVAIGGANNDTGLKVAATTTAIFTFGTFNGTVDMDPGAGVTNLTSTPANVDNTYFARFDNSMNFVWADGINSSLGNFYLGNNDLYISSNVPSTAVDYDPGVGTAFATSTNGSADAILAKYDLNGSFIWLKSFGGDSFESVPSIVVDATDQIYLTGFFQSTTDLNPAGGAPYLSAGTYDSYLAKWDPNGNLVWAKTWGASTGVCQSSSVGILNSNQLFVTGVFTGTIDLDPGAGVTNATANGSQDGFLSLFDNTGILLNGFGYGGTGNDFGTLVRTDGLTTIDVMGSYSGTTDFDPTTDVSGLTVQNTNYIDGFISGYSLLAAVPTAQPTSFGFSNITSSSVDYSFSAASGSPAGYVVVRKSGSAPTGVPKDGQAYVAGSSIGDGTVVQASAALSGTASLLSANTNYFFKVYSFNGSGTSTNYLPGTPLQGSSATTVTTYDIINDSLALVSLYNSLGGSGWTNKTNWLTGPINGWFGVTVSTGRVAALNLPTNNLVGQLPGSIGNLTALVNLSLPNNHINGSIPNELGSISTLSNLSLGSNSLSGAIPGSLMSLTNLTVLNLSGNKLSGVIPPLIGNLTQLNYLNLNNNQLTGSIPNSIGALTNLLNLELFSNQLSGSLPPELGSLTALTDFSFNSNKFTGSIPVEIGSMTSLLNIVGDDNPLTGSIPTSLVGLTSIQYLSFSRCQLSGTIPAEIGTLTSLLQIWFDSNKLSGAIPSNFANLSNLTYLALDNNSFTDLPDLSGITTLATLSLASNQFTFEDLEPNASIFSSANDYNPQATFGAASEQSIAAGQPLNLSFTVGGASNVYQWKNGVANVGANSNSFSNPAVATADAGTYTLTVTNPLVPGLTLTSANQVVAVMAQGLFQWTAAGALTNEGLTVNSTTDQNYSGQWGDYNNDGFEDLFVTGIATQERSYLFKNNGDGTFTKASTNSYFYTSGRSVAWADYNNDGFLDAFAPAGNFATDSVAIAYILKNKGNGTFTKVALPGSPSILAGTWADTDNDGDVDLLADGGSGFPILYRNDGGDTFVALQPFTTNVSSGWNNIAIDANNDGKLDYYIPDETQRNLYFGNGNNSFTLNPSTPLVTDPLTISRGASWADIDNDGDFDAFVISSTIDDKFYINNGHGVFTSQSTLSVLGETVFGGRGSAFADFDNDGYVDLLAFNSNPANPAGWYLFKNNGNGTFTRQANQNFRIANALVGASFGDYNNDGFLDIFSSSFGSDYNGLYKNIGNSNHWLQVKLRGKASNRSGIGAKVSVKAGGFWRHQQIVVANGFGNQNSLIAQFGLGASAVADSVKIQWPSGFQQVSTNVPANQRALITEVSADSVALVAFYNATNGPGWTTKTNWLSGPMNTWFGVTVRNNRVAKIILNGNNLSGNIPTVIGNLSALDTIMITSNNLTGSIPSALGNISNLKYFDLAGNQLTGSLPASLFTLTQLNTFGMHANRLSGTIPAAIGNLVNLKNFWIDANLFTGALPPEVNNMSKIQNFYIQDNQFTSVPTLNGFTLIGGSIQNNFLNFNSLIPNGAIANLQFSPQKNIPVGDTVNVSTGSPFSMTYDAGGTGTVYQWYRNSVSIVSDNLQTHQTAAALPSDAGQYYQAATNPGLAGVTLQTTLFIVQVFSLAAPDDSGYKFLKKLGAEALSINQNQPVGRVSVDNSGNYYYVNANTSNGSTFQKTDPSGNLLSTTLSSGNLDIAGTDIAIDGQNSVYVSGPGYFTMRKYNSSGSLVFETPTYAGYRPFQTMVVDPTDGSILAMDESGNGLVRRFDNTTGNLIGQITLTGAPVGYYGEVFDLGVDASGNIYVPDAGRIDKFSSTGVFISSFDLSMLAGWGALIFQVASNGHLFVAPWLAGYTNNSTIYHFDNTGVLVSNFGQDFSNVAWASLTLSASNEIVLAGLSFGIFRFDLNGNFLGFAESRNANGQFSFPVNAANDSKGNRYVVDQFNNRIQKFDSKGAFVTSFGAPGSGAGQFDKPASVAVDNSDNIYVADAGNNRIQKFTATGTPLLSWGTTGSANGQFSNPSSISISPDGFLYVADANNYRIQKFTTAGTYLLSFGAQGGAPDQFSTKPGMIANEDDGNILVVDQGNVKRFDETGKFLTALDLSGYGTGELTTDRSGNIYVTTPSVVRKFDKLGGLITTIGKTGIADGQFQIANAVSSNVAGDTLWITDYQLNRVSVFTANFRTATASDSLALVDLYNSTTGAGWTNKTNWLTGTVDTWYGVTLSGGKIRDINLAGNLLTGTLPASLTTLDDLLNLDFHNNKLSGGWPDWTGPSSMAVLDLSGNLLAGALTTLPAQLQRVNFSNNKLTAVATLPPLINTADLSLNKLTQLGNMTATSIDTLKVEKNNLAFGDLEANISIPSFTYIPQDSVDLFESLLKQVNDTQTFSAVLSGTANAYQWQKNGSALAGETNTSLTLSNITFKDDATYTYAATNSIVTGLTLFSHKKILRVSSLQRDSIALVALFLATGGNNWTNHSNWATTPISSGWFGVTISNNRVVSVVLPNNNLVGNVPVVFADVQELTTVDLSSNQIQSLPDLTSIPGLTTLDVSNNNLDFASLIANTAITGINYPNQANLGVAIDTLVNYGTNYNLVVSTKGTGNVYQWTRNGSPVTGASDTTFLIAAINRANMGTYVCEVTNPAVPSLTLKTNNKRVRAVAKLTGKFVLPDSTAINQANIILLNIKPIGAYDTTLIKPVAADGTFLLDKVVLDDYVILAKPDTIAFPTALPSYYRNTIFWEAADSLQVFSNRSGLTIVDVTKPSPPKGSGSISGTLEDLGTSVSGGRVEAGRRVTGAGVAASRSLAVGRPMGSGYALVAYVLTDDDGKFDIENLPTGNYRLNIQYPGYPMDTTSFINFTIGSSPSTKQVIVSAAVDKNKIVVTLLKITGLGEADHRFSVYPNPAHIAFNIRMNEALGEVEYSVSSVLGQTVKSGKLNETQESRIDMTGLAAGIYLVELTQGGRVMKTFKIVLE